MGEAKVRREKYPGLYGTIGCPGAGVRPAKSSSGDVELLWSGRTVAYRPTRRAQKRARMEAKKLRSRERRNELRMIWGLRAINKILGGDPKVDDLTW